MKVYCEKKEEKGKSTASPAFWVVLASIKEVSSSVPPLAVYIAAI